MLLACRVPLVMAVEQTGAARVIADAVVVHLPTTDPIVVVGATLGFAALLTPFVDNVSVAAVLSPVAAGVATRSGIPIEPLLVAVAIGASLDFLTPFGRSEEHTSELQSLMRISYAVFCLKKKNTNKMP